MSQHSNPSELELISAIDSVVKGWSRSVELRDGEVEGHTVEAAEMTVRLARAMGMAEEELIHVRRGVLLHDIGMLTVRDEIVFKPGTLTEEEKTKMRNHPAVAFDLLSHIPVLGPALDIPYCHHERWDGMGYPRRLAGESIPLAARVFAVVDVWDALRSQRPFRQAWSDTQVLKRISSLAGTVFDPTVAKKFLELVADRMPPADPPKSSPTNDETSG